MKIYNCPDCLFLNDTCENCLRYQTYHKSNINNSQEEEKIYTLTYIPSACRSCPNHPSNGGNGNCNCTLGGLEIYC